MIQRIQTVYFLLTAVLSIIAACFPLGRWINQAGEVTGRMGAFTITQNDEWYFSPFGVMLIMVALAALVSIIIYHHRVYQSRLAILGMLILFGGYVVYAIYAMYMTMDGESFRPEWPAALPIVGVWLLWLAWRAVMRDEMLVRSLDRLR